MVADRLRNLGAEAPRASGFREARVECDEAMPAIGAQREMESVGGRELQRRIARKERGKRPRGRGMRESPRPVPGEIVEV